MNVRVQVDRYSWTRVPGFFLCYDEEDAHIFPRDFAYVTYSDGTEGVATYAEVMAAGIPSGERVNQNCPGTGEVLILVIHGRVVELRALS